MLKSYTGDEPVSGGIEYPSLVTHNGIVLLAIAPMGNGTYFSGVVVIPNDNSGSVGYYGQHYHKNFWKKYIGKVTLVSL